MTLKQHLIAGAIGTALLYPILGGWRSGVFFASSILIDADHYLDYLWRTRGKDGWPKDWKPKSMFRYYDQFEVHIKDKRILVFSLLHTAEAYIAIYLLALFVNYDLFITVLGGMAFHMLFDVIPMAYRQLHFLRPFSLTEHFTRRRIMKKKGIDVEGFYKEMFSISQSK